MGISKRSFGVTKDGKETFLYTITNEKGMEAAVTNFGAILVQLMVPGRQRQENGMWFLDLIL